MYYIIKSQNRTKGVDRLTELRDKLLKKKDYPESFSLDKENFSEDRLQELILSEGLFQNRLLVTAKDIFSLPETYEIAKKYLEKIKDSDNLFIFLETNLKGVKSKKIEKLAKKVEEKKTKKKEKKDFKPFALTDALAEKKSKDAWFSYREALIEGKDPGEILGILNWQVKNLILARQTKNAKEAGLSPYPYKKAKQYTKNFKDAELERINRELIDLYHKTRRGQIDLEFGIEKFLLSL